jgi:hypothetical protein
VDEESEESDEDKEVLGGKIQGVAAGEYGLY